MDHKGDFQHVTFTEKEAEYLAERIDEFGNARHFKQVLDSKFRVTYDQKTEEHYLTDEYFFKFVENIKKYKPEEQFRKK